MVARDITDSESLKLWLRVRPVEDSQVVAARVALRAVPALEDASGLGSDANVVLATFQANAIAMRVATSPEVRAVLTRAAVFAAAIADAAAAQASSAVILAPASALAARAARDAARVHNMDANVASSAASSAAQFAAFSMRAETLERRAERFGLKNSLFESVQASADSAKIAVSELWANVKTDAEKLEFGTRSEVLLCDPLWANDVPQWAKLGWNATKRNLLKRPAEHWDAWTDWYDALLRGEPGNEEEEIARIFEVTEDEWKAGSAVANKKIKDIIVRFRSGPALTVTKHAASVPAAARAPLFISHATAADGATANALVAALEDAGQPCWIAPRDIPAGADWNGSILAAIEACAGVVLLVSEASVASRFVQAEIQHAFDWKKKVVPVRLAEAEPARLDLRLKTVQQVRLGGDLVVVTRELRAAFV